MMSWLLAVQSISLNMIFMHQDTLLDYSEPCNRAELKTIYLSKFEANKPENKMIEIDILE